MSQDHHHALPVGTRVQCYEVRRVLGIGGFGITYSAFDHSLGCEVAMKEYLPGHVALRARDGTTVMPKSEPDRESYVHGLTRFLDEARTLARFRHPNIVRVTRFLEDHGTAYMIMDYEDGEPLSSYIERGHRFSEAELKGIIVPILHGLRAVHAKNFLHRDIKPANIYVRKTRSPVLLDFGAAREGIGLHARAMTGMVTPGYAPFEQYYTLDKYGPWSDLYATGATLYHCITGVLPVAATDRVAALHEGEPDPLVNLAEVVRNRHSATFLRAIDWMLRALAKDRPQTVDQVLAVLLRASDAEPVPAPTTGDAAPVSRPAAAAALPKTMKIDAAAHPGPTWNGNTLAALARDLATYLGPIARILVRRAAQRTADPDTLLRLLAAEIQDARERTGFLMSARKAVESPSGLH